MEIKATPATDEEVAILNKYFERFVQMCNDCNEELRNNELTTKCMSLALSRYGTFSTLDGGYLDQRSEQLISDKMLMALYEGIGECVENIQPPKGGILAPNNIKH